MIMPPHETPQREPASAGTPRRRADFWFALTFAIIANLIFLGLLVFSVSWRNPPPVPVTAELYAPPTPQPVAPPKPPEPTPLPPPPVAPPPEVKPPEQPNPDIAIQKKKEEERRKHEAEEAARKKKEAEDKTRQEKLEKERLEKERVEKAAREKAEKERKEAEQRRLADAQKAREEEAQREAELQKVLAEQAKRDNLQAAQDRWIQSIRIKVKGNLILPPNIEGNPETRFLIAQLPTGEVIDAKLQKSSGNSAYDDAVYRAIMKSSPLPKPERTDLFRRELLFVFKPKE